MTGSTVLLAAAAIVGLVVLAFVISFNRFVVQRNHIREAWANIDTELRRRYDLVPNLVETVKGYAEHERSVLEQVIRARAAAVGDHGTPEHQARTEQGLVRTLRELFAVAERYPELKADEHFGRLQSELVTTEDRIQLARRIYNANVRDLNRRVQAVPSNLVAQVVGITEAEYFEVDEAIRTGSAPATAF